ncbi:MAG: hypothetical protein K2X81_18195, partial [Candidatus Obscuribacterales bacterium]|nr:hypothetical protein [Candidatus Obscuribacterales bacterium]
MSSESSKQKSGKHALFLVVPYLLAISAASHIESLIIPCLAEEDVSLEHKQKLPLMPLLTLKINTQTYIEKKLNAAVKHMAALPEPATTETYFASPEWTTGETTEEKAADNAIHLLYKTLEALPQRDHSLFQAAFAQFSEAYKTLSQSDRNILSYYLITMMGGSTSSWQNFDGKDATILVCLSIDLSNATNNRGNSHLRNMCRETLIKRAIKYGHPKEAIILARMNVTDLAQEFESIQPREQADSTKILNQLCDAYEAQHRYLEAEAAALEILDQLAKTKKSNTISSVPVRCRLISFALQQHHLTEIESQFDIINDILATTLFLEKPQSIKEKEAV